MHTDKIMVFVTASSEEEAKKIASSLVQNKLAACCNTGIPVASFFNWEGKECEEQEYLIIAKSLVELLDAVIEHVKKIHSY